MKVSELVAYQKNTDFFDDLMGEDFERLKKSILNNGIIEPIVINQDKVIISGHQRLRACIELGIEEVPVHIIKVKNMDDHEVKLIESNLVGRRLSTSEIARGIKRLYEIKGINGQGNRGDLTCATVAQVVKEIGMPERTVKRLRTIADLVPELSKLMDNGQITEKNAYQFAQLDEESQRDIHRQLADAQEKLKLTEKEAKKIKEAYKSQKETIYSLNKQIDELKDKAPTAEVMEELQRLTSELEAERNKPVQIVEKEIIVEKEVVKFPDDYESIKKESEKVHEENQRLSKEIERTNRTGISEFSKSESDVLLVIDEANKFAKQAVRLFSEMTNSDKFAKHFFEQYWKGRDAIDLLKYEFYQNNKYRQGYKNGVRIY